MEGPAAMTAGCISSNSVRTGCSTGRFVTLVPNELVVEVDEFETADPVMRGEMTIMISDANGGMDLVAVHERLPVGVSAVDNESGWREARARLAALVQTCPVADQQGYSATPACRQAQNTSLLTWRARHLRSIRTGRV